MSQPTADRRRLPSVRRPGRGPAAAVVTGLAVSLAWLVAAPAGAATVTSDRVGLAPAGHLAGPASARSKRAAAVAQARKGLLTLADMPAGWIASKGSGSNSTPGAASLARCVGVPTSLIVDNFPQAFSPDFANTDQSLSVDDDVVVYPSAAVARAELAAEASPKTPPCEESVFRSLRAEIGKEVGGTITSVSITRSVASFGPHTTALLASLGVNVSGHHLDIHSLEVLGVDGHEGQQITFTGTQVTPTLALERPIVAKALSLI